MFRALSWIGCLVGVLLLHAATASAHDLKLDRLSLFPDPVGARLTGQLTLDPELTRGLVDAPTPAHAAQLLRIVERDVSLLADGQRLSPTFEVRELWTPNGAVSGDIVMFQSPLPADTRTLNARLEGAIPALVLSVQPKQSEGVGPTHSTLLRVGSSSPDYRLPITAAGPPQDAKTWRPGGPEQFAETDASLDSTEPEEPTTLGFEERGGSSFAAYLWLGFVHVLPLGWDHVLFVLGITLGVGRKWRRLLPQLTLFTLAHTLTLGLGATGIQLLPSPVIEPLIALSVAYVGLENLLSETRRFRLASIFAFGLLHGQGFASALLDVGLPRDSFVASLLAFNVGVELAQIVVAGVAAALLMAVPVSTRGTRKVERSASYAIALVGALWVIERLVSELGLL